MRGNGSYLSSNIISQLNSERTEEQIEREATRILRLARQCPRYQKYREPKPIDAKQKEAKWPDHLEYAFFKGMSFAMSMVDRH